MVHYKVKLFQLSILNRTDIHMDGDYYFQISGHSRKFDIFGAPTFFKAAPYREIQDEIQPKSFSSLALAIKCLQTSGHIQCPVQRVSGKSGLTDGQNMKFPVRYRTLRDFNSQQIIRLTFTLWFYCIHCLFP